MDPLKFEINNLRQKLYNLKFVGVLILIVCISVPIFIYMDMDFKNERLIAENNALKAPCQGVYVLANGTYSGTENFYYWSDGRYTDAHFFSYISGISYEIDEDIYDKLNDHIPVGSYIILMARNCTSVASIIGFSTTEVSVLF